MVIILNPMAIIIYHAISQEHVKDSNKKTKKQKKFIMIIIYLILLTFKAQD